MTLPDTPPDLHRSLITSPSRRRCTGSAGTATRSTSIPASRARPASPAPSSTACARSASPPIRWTRGRAGPAAGVARRALHAAGVPGETLELEAWWTMPGALRACRPRTARCWTASRPGSRRHSRAGTVARSHDEGSGRRSGGAGARPAGARRRTRAAPAARRRRPPASRRATRSCPTRRGASRTATATRRPRRRIPACAPRTCASRTCDLPGIPIQTSSRPLRGRRTRRLGIADRQRGPPRRLQGRRSDGPADRRLRARPSGRRTRPPAASGGLSGSYNILDRDGRFIVPRQTVIDVFADSRAGDRTSQDPARQAVRVAPRGLLPVDDRIAGATMTYDGYIAFATAQGVVGLVPRNPAG